MVAKLAQNDQTACEPALLVRLRSHCARDPSTLTVVEKGTRRKGDADVFRQRVRVPFSRLFPLFRLRLHFFPSVVYAADLSMCRP
jgi:hypothetical protein